MQNIDPSPAKRRLRGALETLVGCGLVLFYFWALRHWERQFVLAGIFGCALAARGIAAMLNLTGRR